MRAYLKELESNVDEKLITKRPIRIGVLAINAQNFEDDDKPKNKSDSKRIGNIINEYISGDSLDVIAIGMTFGSQFTTEKDDGPQDPASAYDKGRDKSRFI